ncbi:hypothetical protein OZX60_03345 [Streptococcaceae bacterium ESL0687]|nr:hypothetical protein OZX60_03345 [Streptococcaceae bacterium ESL0687]
MTILESIMSAKMADLFIPLAVYLSTGTFNLKTYILAIITTLLVLFWFRDGKSNKGDFVRGIFIIVPLLVIQAYLSPILVGNYKNSLEQIISFTLATLVLRFIICMFPLFTRRRIKGNFNLNGNSLVLYSVRSILTVLAQFTFTIVTSSPLAAVGWIFLNMSSLYGLIASSLIIKEKNTGREVLLIFIITFIMILEKFI